MDLTRPQESLKAADLCLREGLVSSAASRAYYAMFQAAQIALEAEGFARTEWSHRGLHSSFNQQLIQQKKAYPRVFRNYLTSALTIRQAPCIRKRPPKPRPGLQPNWIRLTIAAEAG